MNTLRKGSKGPLVRAIMFYLTGIGMYQGTVDSSFGPLMEEAVKRYQRARSLVEDGTVGPRTLAALVSEGMSIPIPVTGSDSPKRPPFGSPNNMWARLTFGEFKYHSAPEPGNKENIVIEGAWEDENIVSVSVEGLDAVDKDGRIRLHRKVAAQVQGFFKEVKDKGLSNLIISSDGAFVPRFQRGSKTALSNHSWGSAFDLNADYNGLGKTPAGYGEQGCLLPLVPIAHTWGLYWGGHFSRCDGMHFEVGKILSAGQKLNIDYDRSTFTFIEA